MAFDLPTIPDSKIEFYRRKLWREVSNLFIWEGMPPEIPLDYLERELVTSGCALFFYDKATYGHMALATTIKGFNSYKQPTQALCVAPNDQGKPVAYDRLIIHKYDELIPKETCGVLINNMYNREGLMEIVEHYAYRMTLIQNAFDTNALWQNLPVTWSVSDAAMQLSIEKWFSDIYSGKPMIIMDKSLNSGENEIVGNITEVPFLLDKLYDAKTEVYNEFKSTIGLNAPGADKKERLVVAEATSNEESKDTCLNIMLSQREIACEEINKVFGLNVTCRLATSETNEGGEKDGEGNDGTEDGLANGKLKSV